MRENVLRYIRERELLHAGDRVAVAVSGGADSVALLRVLLELQTELGLVLFVAHFNHLLRAAESDADERFVAELARQHELPFSAGRADVREHAKVRKLSLEHAARGLRYRWLHQLAIEEKLSAIATGHTLDDQAETVLMKLLRGAGTGGLAGIRPVMMLEHCPVVRPLLATTRSEIEAFLATCSQPWREDHTNRDTRLTRNRIRHQLLPLFERDYNPNIRQVLSETAEIALAEDEFWREHIAALVPRWHQRVRAMRLQEYDGTTAGFLSSKVAMQRHALKQFLEWHGIKVDFHHIEEVRKCAVGAVPRVYLPGSWQAQRDGEWLELTPPPVQTPEPLPDGYMYCVRISDQCVIPEASLTIQTIILPAEAAAREPSGTLLRAAVIDPELTFRNWLPGDRFRPAHSASEEKLKRLFSKRHIPADQRPLWPVALSGSRIVWVREFPVAHDFAWLPGSGDALKIEVSDAI